MNPAALKKILLFLFAFTGIFVFGQLSSGEKKQCDSLSSVLLKKNIHDTSRADAYVRLSEILYVAFPDTMFSLSQSALHIAKMNLSKKGLKREETRKFKNLEASAQSNLGFYYMGKGEFEKSLELFKAGLLVYEEQGDGEGMSSSYVNMAIIFHNTGKTDLCLAYYDKALAIATKMGDKNAQSYCLHNMGAVHVNLGNDKKAVALLEQSAALNKELQNFRGMAHDYQYMGIVYLNKGDVIRALENFHESLKLHEKTGDKSGIAESLHNIASIYKDQGEVVKAMEYYRLCIKTSSETGNRIMLASAFNGVGLMFEKRKNYDSALVYFKKALSLQNEMNNVSGKAVALQNLGGLYEDRHQPNDAISCYEQSLQLRREVGDLQGQGYVYEALSSLYVLNNNVRDAKRCAEKCLEIALKLKYPKSISGAAYCMSAVYKKIGNYKEGWEMYELYIKMRDSTRNEQTRKSAFKKQLQYEYDRKATADSIRNAEEGKVKDAQLAEQKAIVKQEKTQRFALYGGIVFLIVFGIFMVNRFMHSKKQRNTIQHQKELVEEKQKEILDSIHYAKRIQKALLTSERYIARKLGENNPGRKN